MSFNVLDELRLSETEILVILNVDTPDAEYEVVIMDTSAKTPKKTYVQSFISKNDAVMAFKRRGMFNGAKARSI